MFFFCVSRLRIKFISIYESLLSWMIIIVVFARVVQGSVMASSLFLTKADKCLSKITVINPFTLQEKNAIFADSGF